MNWEQPSISDKPADVIFGGPPNQKPVTDGDLDWLEQQIENALKTLPKKAQRLFAAEFCGDEIPSVMDDSEAPYPAADEFVLPMPSWEEA